MPPLVIAGVMAATMVAGTAMSVMAAKRSGQVGSDTAILNSRLQARESIAQAQMAENQALIAERDAQMSDYAAVAEREATAFDVARMKEQGTAFQAQQRVDIAGSGLEARGSPLLVMAETAKQLELDRLATTHAGDVAAREHEDQARMSRYGGKLATYQAEQLRKGIPLTLDIGRYQARAIRQGANLQATSSIISGAGRAFGAYYGARG